MLLRPFLNDETSGASYLFGCTTHGTLAVVDPHVNLVDRYVAAASRLEARISHIAKRVCARQLARPCVASV